MNINQNEHAKTITYRYPSQYIKRESSLLSFHFSFCLVSSLSLCGNLRRGMPIRVALIFYLRRVNITQRGAVSVVSVLCHVRKFGPRGGFGQIPLCENKIVVLRVIIYDCTYLKRLTPLVVVRFAVTSRGSYRFCPW